MNTASTILAGLVAMFAGYVASLDTLPTVSCYTPSASNAEWRLGQTDCGKRTKKSTGESEPFCRIYLNECLLEAAPSQLIDTSLHELAHAVDYLSDGVWENHGGQWKSLTRKWHLVSHAATVGQIKGCEIPTRGRL